MKLLPMALRVAGVLTSKTRGEKEDVAKRTYDDFRKEWDGRNVFLRFENKKYSERDAWNPASLNRDNTYGDIWGVWAFYLKYGWPSTSGLLKFGSAYIFTLRGSPTILDTGSYSEDQWQSDLAKLRKEYGDDVGNAKKHWEHGKDAWVENVGDHQEFDEPDPSTDGIPAWRLYKTVQYIKGTTKSTNFVFRKLGYDVIIDSGEVTSEGVYSPAVSAVILDPTIIEIQDSSAVKAD